MNDCLRDEYVTMHQTGNAIGPRPMAACLFALSFGTVLYALAIFKLLSFFIMPSLFFDLLFIGFPIGAFLGVRYLDVSLRSFLRSLWALQAIMAISIGGSLLAKRFDYLRAHPFDIELIWLVGQIGVFVGLYLPFFAAYGLNEYLGYQVGRRTLGGRMRAVYTLALLGAAAAYLFFQTTLPVLGMARTLMTSFAGIALAIFVLGPGASRRMATAQFALLLLMMWIPGSEAGFLQLYKGRGQLSTWEHQELMGYSTVFQRWGRYSLCEILAAPDRSNYHGFYNDMFQWEYSPQFGFSEPSLGAIPILRTRPGDHLAIIGAGGGRQVRLAERLGGRTIVALELEPAVFDAVRSPDHLLNAFGRVYEQPGVVAIRGEARGYLERSLERFDLIYLPSVGGYAQMMIEPGNMIRTQQAYQLMRDRLTDAGTIAIWYPRGLDHKGILTDQYVRALRALGLHTRAYVNDFEFLILAEFEPPPDAIEIAGLLPAAIDEGVLPREYVVDDDPTFVPITDEKPFLAGNVRYILSMEQVLRLFVLGIFLVMGFGVLIFRSLRGRGDPQIPGRSLSSVAALSLLIGANFLLMEHVLVLSLFREIYVYSDAIALGAIAFLTISGLGSLVISSRTRSIQAGLATLAAIALLLTPASERSVFAVFALMAPIALVTGSLFPALFEKAARNPLSVFAMDGVGAGLGALTATFVPILFGFEVFFVFAITVFILTALADIAFHAPLERPGDPSGIPSHRPALPIGWLSRRLHP